MTLLHETTHFTLSVPRNSHVDRLDGGHLVINPKVPVEHRTQLSPTQVIELARLTMLAGEAMMQGLRARGIPLGRINYQDNGNWRPVFHVHLYGRSTDAKRQPYGEALVFHKPPHPQYDGIEALNAEDCAAILTMLSRLEQTEKYREEYWFVRETALV